MEKQRISAHQLRRIKTTLWCWAFVFPIVFVYVMLTLWPIISGLGYSALDWSGIGQGTFVGIANYKELLKDHLFWNSFTNSFIYMLYYVPPELCLSLLIAYILNLGIKGATFYRTLYFLPVVTTAAIIGIIMIFIFGSTGPVNAVAQMMGIVKHPFNFLGERSSAMITLSIVSVWKSLGIFMIYWLAALQSVPKDVYEAATVDGAGRARTFFSVVLPEILPIGAMIAILCTLNSLKVFDIVQTMTGGGPYFATDVIATFVYRTAFDASSGSPRVGYACAAGLLFGFFIIVIGVALNQAKKVLKKAA